LQLDVETVRQVPLPLQVRAGVAVAPVQAGATHCVPVTYSRQAPAPLQVPSLPQLAAPASVHWFSGSCPAGTVVHVPRLPAIAHERQVVLQTLAQQMPCAQTLFAQSPFAVQVAPLGRRVHAPPEQMLGATQSPSTVHDVRQAPVPQLYAPHEIGAVVWQVPVPLHVRAGVTVEPVHVAATQVVPAAYRRQPPPPSQKPSAPHVATPASVHWFSGSCPLGTFTQAPIVPAIAHERQLPVQVPMQHTPWAQLPELHSPLPAHAAPSGFRPQLPVLQTLGDAQSALVVHVVRQAPVPHA